MENIGKEPLQYASKKNRGALRHEEDRLQKHCIHWFDLQYPEYSLLMHHSPNGGYRTSYEGKNFKMMGTRAGFPDLILLLPRMGFTALAIEMKTPKGVQSDHQKEWEECAKKNGIGYVIVRSLDEFMHLVTQYLQG